MAIFKDSSRPAKNPGAVVYSHDSYRRRTRNEAVSAPMEADAEACEADAVLAADSAPRDPGTGRAYVRTKPGQDY